MRPWIILLLLIFWINMAYSQRDSTAKRSIRLSADNDAFIPTNNATDWGYTSGIRIDVFCSSDNTRGVFQGINVYHHFERVNTSGWGIMQMIIAPKKTSLIIPDKNDYPYAGALFAIHSFHVSNSLKKINLLSECIVGVMGPPSLGEQTHRFFHRLIKDPAPMGWDYQLPTDLLLNLNLKMEKLLSNSKSIGFFGNAEIRCGTMNDGMSAGLQLRFGNTTNYVSGLTRQYFAEKKTQLSFSLKTSAGLTLYNALLQGGLFNKRSPVHDKDSKLGTDRKLQYFGASAELSLLLSMKKLAASFQQKLVSSELKGYGSHSFGNISLYWLMK